MKFFVRRLAREARTFLMGAAHRVALNSLKARKKHSVQVRWLELGPGYNRIDGFETMNVEWTRATDYVHDISRPFPFRDQTFNLIYASHVLEHLPWYSRHSVLAECFRVLRSGGTIEVWVPDGLKICRAFVDAEQHDCREFESDGWQKFNDKNDPAVWANGRIFSYGDGTGNKQSPNWHMTIYSERLLRKTLEEVGFTNVRLLNRSEVRGYDHGWINLGLAAEKPLDK